MGIVHNNKTEINSSELETQEYTSYDKPEDVVSTQIPKKLLGSSFGVGKLNQHNSDANMPVVEKKETRKREPKHKQEDSDLEDDVLAKDEFEMIRSLRKVIHKKYKVIEVIGKGSYGCVSKAMCRETGKYVALKVMKNQTLTEYELIKLLREI